MMEAYIVYLEKIEYTAQSLLYGNYLQLKTFFPRVDVAHYTYYMNKAQMASTAETWKSL